MTEVKPLVLTAVQKERIWQGQYWGPNGVLDEIRRVYDTATDGTNSSDVVLLSAEYSAAGRAFQDMKQGSIPAIWRFLDSAMRARRRALYLAPLLTVKDGADHLDVVASVLIRFGAKKQAKRMLLDLPWYAFGSRSGAKPHSVAFILGHAVKAQAVMSALNFLTEIEEMALLTEEYDMRQAVRVWRLLKDLLMSYMDSESEKIKYAPWLERVNRHLERCSELAGSADQKVKML